MADGPLIQRASHSVLEAGFSIADAVAIIKEVRSACPDTPINLLTYFNLALSNGVEPFLTRFKAAGVDAVTFVDLPLEEMEEIYAVVHDAKQKGVRAVKAGLPVRELDMIVRGYIEERGCGEFFRHGTGHGVGIAVHEPPAITARGDGLLEENMIITIEPGIYLPNKGGVRLEDMVLVRENEGEVLTHLRKDLFDIQGGLS
jgi:methionine aminopeptidase